MSRILQILLSLVITVAALWYSLHGVEFGSFIQDLSGARWVWILPLAVTAVASLWFRARRWRVLLDSIAPIGDAPVFDATCIGFMGNMVLPLRAGEVIKPIVVARSGTVTAPAALATVALERMCDLIMLAVLGAVTLVLVPQADFLHAQTEVVFWIFGVALVAICLVIRWAVWLEERLEFVARRLPVSLGRIVQEAGRGLLRSMAGLADIGVSIRVFGYTALIWLVTVLGFVAVALALEIDAPLLPLGCAATVIVALAVSVPSAPGYIGVFWAGSEVALGLFDIPKSMGFTFGVLNWLVQLLVIVVLGVWSMSRLQLSLGEMRRVASLSPKDEQVRKESS